MKAKILMAAFAAATLSTAAGAQSFQNGSFEDGPSAGSFTTLNGGSTAITGWTVTGNSVDYIGSYWQAADGGRSVDLNGNGQGGIAQTFDTTSNLTYRVSFSLAGNPDGAPDTKTISTVTTGGASNLFTFSTPGNTRTDMGWTPYSFTFKASGPSTTLTFASQDPGAYGAALDAVSVSAVPEPASWALMIMGFGLAGGALRRRRSAVAAVA